MHHCIYLGALDHLTILDCHRALCRVRKACYNPRTEYSQSSSASKNEMICSRNYISFIFVETEMENWCEVTYAWVGNGKNARGATMRASPSSWVTKNEDLASAREKRLGVEALMPERLLRGEPSRRF